MDNVVNFLSVDFNGNPRNRLLCLLLFALTLSRNHEENSWTPIALWSIGGMRRLRLDEKIDLVFDRKIALRFYADSRPHTFQTAKLQKGAIIVCNGFELVEEGLGIGVPVCRYRYSTRFSLDADTFVDDSDKNPALIKIYEMNGIASKRFRGFPIRRGSSLARLLKVLEKGYRGLRRFSTEATMMLDTLSLLGMRNEYVESSSKGRVAVTYRRGGRGLEIEAALEGLSSDGLQGIIFANEQGGRLFDEYRDSTGIKLHDGQIEPWRTTQAEWASLHSRTLHVGYRLRRSRGWLIVRGREVVRDRISWSGLDLFCPETPQTLEYLIEIVGDGTD